MKTCSKCGTRHAAADFRKDPRGYGDGRQAFCILCESQDQAKRRSKPRHKKRHRRYELRWRQKNKQKVSKRNRRYRQRHPLAMKAKAIRDYEIKKGLAARVRVRK